MDTKEVQQIKERSLKRQNAASDVILLLITEKKIEPFEAYVILDMAKSQLYKAIQKKEQVKDESNF